MRQYITKMIFLLFSLPFAVSAYAMPEDSVVNNDGFGKVFKLKDVDFYNETDSLKEAAFNTLDKLYQRLNERKKLSVKIAGHVSSAVDEKKQLKVSSLRANRVKDYLTNKGIDAERVLALGMGVKDPALPENPEAAENNRIEVSFKKAKKSSIYGKAYFFENVKFSSMGDTLFASSYPALERFSKQLEQNSKMEIKVTGHASTSGTDEYDMRLSLNRALTVKNYLVGNGINPARIVCEATGNRDIDAAAASDGQKVGNRIEIAFKKHQVSNDTEYREPSILKNVGFVGSQLKLKEGSEQSLDKLGELMQNKPSLKIIVTTYSTSKTGKEAITLSYQRSQKIRQYLVDEFMINTNRIVLHEGGYPRTKDKPKNPNWVEVQLSK